MVPVVVGTDSYGRVKCVGKTPIVTRFEMLQMFPLRPIESMYFCGMGEEET